MSKSNKWIFALSFTLIGSSAWGFQAQADAVLGVALPASTPKFVASARNLGPEDLSKNIAITVWMKVRDRRALDELAAELYDPDSSNYHRWIKPEEFRARFAPSREDLRTVQQFLVSHNLSIESVGPDNLFVRARGSVETVSKAFRVQLNNFELNGKVVRSNMTDPLVVGPAASLIRSIGGLDTMEYKHPIRLASQARKSLGAGPAAMVATDSTFFTSNCFTGPRTENYSTNGGFPKATYKGAGYFTSQTEPGCGYVPQDIYSAYNLTSLYNAGFDGTGQSIVIIDWCGSPTVMSDANAFSARFGLPPLTDANFRIINYPQASTCSGESVEINLDVEWAHAIAPGANIVLLVPPSASFIDTDTAQLYAELTGLGNVISGSYGAPEAFVSPAELQTQNLISEIGAIQGISANFATGDDGDFSTVTFPPTQTVSVPAASPYATAIGGMSLGFKADHTIKFQTGWGNNETILTYGGSIFDPPINLGFVGGSGGGASAFFPKPRYQAKLAGTTRQLPDISWLADPLTGGVVAITLPGSFPPLTYIPVGGTSLACPMFSALWAIANQEAGAPLGQAAPHLYSMPKRTIIDMLPFSTPFDVTASISPASGVTEQFSAADLMAPLYNTTKFYSILYDDPTQAYTTYAISIGTDTSLTTTAGWDNVTGLGVPNGKAFADYFNPAR